MEIIKPTIEVLTDKVTEKTEYAIRTAYQSQDKISDNSAAGLFRHCFRNRHLSVFEHVYLHIVVNRVSIINFNFKSAFYHRFLNIESDGVNHNLKGSLRCFMDIFYNNIHGLFKAVSVMESIPADKIEMISDLNERKHALIDEFFVLFGDGKDIKRFPFSQTFLETHEETFAVIQFCMDIFNSTFPGSDGKFIQLTPTRVIDNSTYYNTCYANLSGMMSVDHEYYSFKVNTDIGVGREWLRHIMRGVTQESTRYCNYKSKGFKITCPQPFKYAEEFYKVVESGGKLYPLTGKNADNLTKEQKQAKLTWMSLNYVNEKYNELISLGVPAQEARIVLPLGLKAEFVITGHWIEWAHFCFMRTASDAQPQIRLLADQVFEYFNNNLDGQKFLTFMAIADGSRLMATVQK